MGRAGFEEHIGRSVVPIARAIEQQMLRSYVDNALLTARMIDDRREMIAEIEAAGPRFATEIAAESQAMGDMVAEDRASLYQGRAEFEEHLMTFDEGDSLEQDFSRYADSVKNASDKRYAYVKQRVEWTPRIKHAQMSDRDLDNLKGLDLPATKFLMLHPGERQTVFALTGPDPGSAFVRVLEKGNPYLCSCSESFSAATHDEDGFPVSPEAMRNALDDLLAAYGDFLGPCVEKNLPLPREMHLKIFPRLQMNEVPLHALMIGGKRLIEHCDVSYAPTLGLLLQVRGGSTSPAARSLTMVYDDKGTLVYSGTANILKGLYGQDLHIALNPSWDALKMLLRDQKPADIFFACHGEYDPVHLQTSRIDLSDEESVMFSQIFAEMGATGCECVAMGACESGLGRTILTAEYLGLPLAFFAAGARYVIGCLWKVNQLATAILLGYYYQFLKEGKQSVPHALNEAQRTIMKMTKDQVIAWAMTNVPDKVELYRELIRDRPESPLSHPYYWAGLFVTGDL